MVEEEEMVIVYRPCCQLHGEIVRLLLGSIVIRCKVEPYPVNTISVAKSDEDAAKNILYFRGVNIEKEN